MLICAIFVNLKWFHSENLGCYFTATKFNAMFIYICVIPEFFSRCLAFTSSIEL